MLADPQLFTKFAKKCLCWQILLLHIHNMVQLCVNILYASIFAFCHSFAHQVVATLGFDWLLLFLQPQVHIETVVRALRILICLLSESSIRKRFLSGNIFGGWLYGIHSALPDYASEIKKTLLFSGSKTHRSDLCVYMNPCVYVWIFLHLH